MRGERNGFREKAAPVKANDEMDVEIEAVGKKGDGIAKREGFVLFVPNTKKGDKVRIRVLKVLGSAGFAEVISKTPKSGEPEENERESEEGDGEGTEEETEEETEESEGDEEFEDTEDFGEEENQ